MSRLGHLSLVRRRRLGAFVMYPPKSSQVFYARNSLKPFHAAIQSVGNCGPLKGAARAPVTSLRTLLLGPPGTRH